MSEGVQEENIVGLRREITKWEGKKTCIDININNSLVYSYRVLFTYRDCTKRMMQDYCPVTTDLDSPKLGPPSPIFLKNMDP